MILRLILFATLAALAACAHSADRPPVCDGAHRRPATPHGSVLTGPEPAPAAPVGIPDAPAPDGGCA